MPLSSDKNQAFSFTMMVLEHHYGSKSKKEEGFAQPIRMLRVNCRMHADDSKTDIKADRRRRRHPHSHFTLTQRTKM